MKLSEELAWRGFVNQTTFKDLSELDGKPFTFYFGIDPSADSMTIGNLASAMMVRHFISYGHKAVLLVGGATGMIGDPDGKKQERALLSLEEITRNKTAISEQYRTIFAGQEFTVVDNYDWFKGMNYLEFLRDLGKHVPMRQMLGRDFVQSRLGQEGAGISYAEFSYSLIQGYDYLHLYRELGVTLQVCGADQWGNSITGVDLIRRIEGVETHVYSTPLVVNKTTGVKFGKSEAGAIWLDPARTTPTQFYQFWLNADDGGVEDYLKIYTLFTREEIEQIMSDFLAKPQKRLAQRKLAYAVTALVHGEDEADLQWHVADALAGQVAGHLSHDEVNELKKQIPTIDVSPGASVIEVLVQAGLAQSKSEAQRLLRNDAIYVSGQKFAKERFEVGDFMSGRLLLRRGKAFKDSALVELKD